MADGAGVDASARTKQSLGELKRRARFWAEGYRFKGTLLRQVVANTAQAEACFQQALAMARHQQAKSWELRAAMSLSRLGKNQGKREEARQLLAPIYG